MTVPRSVRAALIGALLLLAPAPAEAHTPLNWRFGTHHGSWLHGRADTGLRTLPTGAGPLMSALEASTHTLYVTNGDAGTVSVIDVGACHGGCPGAASPAFAAGAFPVGVAVDPRTRTLYVSDDVGGTIGVFDASRCRAGMTSGCARVAAVAVSGGPAGLAIDPVTNSLYAGTETTDAVAVIDATRCNRVVTSGCSQAPALAKAGPAPLFPAIDGATRTLYVPIVSDGADGPGNSLAVIDTRTCNGRVTSGCGQAPATVTVGSEPSQALVDQDTHTVYVTNAQDATVSLVDGASCNALRTTGCGQAPPTTNVGPFPNSSLALDRQTHRLFVASSFEDVLAVVDTTRCNARVHTACGQRWPTMQTGNVAIWIELDPSARLLYVIDILDESVAVLDPDDCCRDEAPAYPAIDPEQVTVAASVHTAYVTQPGIHGLMLLETRTCDGRAPARCHPVFASVPGISGPFDIDYDAADRTLYATNQDDKDVVLLDPASCNVDHPGGCATVGPAIPIGIGGLLATDPVRHVVYATSFHSDQLAVIDARHCNVRDVSACTATVAHLGMNVYAPAVDPVTGTVYVSNIDDDKVTVLDGTRVKATIAVGHVPQGMEVDPVTRTLYVGNTSFGDGPGSLSVVDLRACTALDTSGCDEAAPTVATGRWPGAVTVDPTTHKVYTADYSHATLSVIDGARCNAFVTSRCDRAPTAIAVGYLPQDIARDPASGTVFATNGRDGSVSVIAG